MCKPASFYLTETRTLWLPTSDSHTDIINHYKLREDDKRNMPLGVRVEISPKGGDLSLPLNEWVYKVDQDATPPWYNKHEAENRSRKALAEWAAHKLNFNVREAFHPVNPLAISPTMGKPEALRLLKKWASVGASVLDSVRASVGASVLDSVRASVGASVWASVGASVLDSVRASVRASVWASVLDSVRDSVRDSVGAYTGSLFPNIATWKYAETLGPNPWAPLRELWINGLVPSFDGKTWRLHHGPNAKVFLTWTPENG